MIVISVNLYYHAFVIYLEDFTSFVPGKRGASSSQEIILNLITMHKKERKQIQGNL